jgi:hypothetical protein
VDPTQIREFARRRWDVVDEQKRHARAERYRSGGPVACLEALGELRARFFRLHPEGSSDGSRQRDLAHHIELGNKLRRIADGRVRR